MSDWTSFGRIDADGTVYVKTADGERVVGSWQAGTPEEGLAHFARRFADLVTEVDPAGGSAGSAAPPIRAQAAASVRRLRDSLAEASVVGDLDGLAARLDKLAPWPTTRRWRPSAAREARGPRRWPARPRWSQEAEQIAAESTSWKAAGDRLQGDLRGVEARSAASTARPTSELWKRYAAARDAFSRRRGAHFAALDAGASRRRPRKEELVAEAEALADSTDWTGTANQLRELMAQWKAAPRASREAEQRLWERFRAAQDAFFTRRSEDFSARDAEQREPGSPAGAGRPGRGAGRGRRPARRPGHAAQHPGPVARDRSGAPRSGRTAGAAAAGGRGEGRPGDGHRLAADRPSENPLLIQMREQVARPRRGWSGPRPPAIPSASPRPSRRWPAKRQFLQLAERSGG